MLMITFLSILENLIEFNFFAKRKTIFASPWLTPICVHKLPSAAADPAFPHNITAPDLFINRRYAALPPSCCGGQRTRGESGDLLSHPENAVVVISEQQEQDKRESVYCNLIKIVWLLFAVFVNIREEDFGSSKSTCTAFAISRYFPHIPLLDWYIFQVIEIHGR